MRARVVIGLLVIMVMVSGCSDYKPAFLSAVELVDPEPVILDEGAPAWRDDQTAFVFPIISASGIFVAIRNNGTTSLRILWDDATIVLPYGATSKAIHGEVRVMDAHLPVAPTVIPPEADWAGPVIPVSQIQWDAASRSYKTVPMWPDSSHLMWITKKYETAAAYDGKHIRLTLPIQRGEQTIEYRFIFRISVARTD